MSSIGTIDTDLEMLFCIKNQDYKEVHSAHQAEIQKKFEKTKYINLEKVKFLKRNWVPVSLHRIAKIERNWERWEDILVDVKKIGSILYGIGNP